MYFLNFKVLYGMNTVFFVLQIHVRFSTTAFHRIKQCGICVTSILGHQSIIRFVLCHSTTVLMAHVIHTLQKKNYKKVKDILKCSRCFVQFHELALIFVFTSRY